MKLGRIPTYTTEQIEGAKNLLGKPVIWDNLDNYIGKRLILEGHTGDSSTGVRDWYTVIQVTEFHKDDQHLYDIKGNIIDTYGSVVYMDNERRKKDIGITGEIYVTNGRFNKPGSSYHMYSGYPSTLYEIKEA